MDNEEGVFNVLLLGALALGAYLFVTGKLAGAWASIASHKPATIVPPIGTAVATPASAASASVAGTPLAGNTGAVSLTPLQSSSQILSSTLADLNALKPYNATILPSSAVTAPTPAVSNLASVYAPKMNLPTYVATGPVVASTPMTPSTGSTGITPLFSGDPAQANNPGYQAGVSLGNAIANLVGRNVANQIATGSSEVTTGIANPATDNTSELLNDTIGTTGFTANGSDIVAPSAPLAYGNTLSSNGPDLGAEQDPSSYILGV